MAGSDRGLRLPWSRPELAVIGGLTAAAVGLAIVAGLLINRYGQLGSMSSERAAVLAAARQAALNFTSFNYARLDEDFARILAETTGPARSDFLRNEANLRRSFTTNQLVSTGHVDQAAVVSVGGTTASVILAVDDDISAAGISATSTPTQRYRMQVAMVYRHGRWLLASVEELA